MLLYRFIVKLQSRTRLSSDNIAALNSLAGQVKTYSAHQLVQLEDETCCKVGFVLSGFLSSFELVHRKRKQVTGFLLPGDAIDIASILTMRPNAHAMAHTRSDVFWVRSSQLADLCFNRPEIASALWLDTLIEAGINREWIANIGQRKAGDRIVHLLLELAARYEGLDGLPNATFDLPVPQYYLASALGMSLVHFNKNLRALERANLIAQNLRSITLLDRAALQEQVAFDPRYLWVGPVQPTQLVAPSETIEQMANLAAPKDLPKVICDRL